MKKLFLFAAIFICQLSFAETLSCICSRYEMSANAIPAIPHVEVHEAIAQAQVNNRQAYERRCNDTAVNRAANRQLVAASPFFNCKVVNKRALLGNN